MFEFEGISKKFGDKQVLKDFNLQVPSGELCGFCGANGAGKTTAMRIALGMLPPDSGRVLWNSEPIGAANRERIGYMPEERGLYGRMRPREQLVYFAGLSGIRKPAARRSADEWLERLNVKMDPKDTVDKLSLGNQQKVQLIAALIHEPDILVLDEPFSGLDPVATDVMATVLTEFTSKGVPVLFSSHQLELVERLCDRVGIIHGGRIIASGTVAELRAGRSDDTVRIRLTGAPEGWESAVPSRTSFDPYSGIVTVHLADAVAVEDVLTIARRFGIVDYVSMEQAPLSDVFRKVVAA